MNSGSYKFEKPETVEETPTVSLYNLLDHSEDQLMILLTAVCQMEIEVRPYKLTRAETYTGLCAWRLLIETAMKERQTRDSEAWADKTANEINEQTKPQTL
jgi:hypothetical protein